MIDVMKIAREAGPLITTPFDKWCEAFAALHREAVLQELMEGVGEPQGCIYIEEYGFIDTNDYTASQVAAAVLRERERCAQVCEALFDRDDDSCDEAERCAAAIRGEQA